jgi:hypothetical protein
MACARLGYLIKPPEWIDFPCNFAFGGQSEIVRLNCFKSLGVVSQPPETGDPFQRLDRAPEVIPLTVIMNIR